MKKFIKKLLIFSIFPILFILGIVAYNYSVDPYGVFRGNISKQANEPNQHYLKVNYILNNPEKYNAFLFGNSRVGKIDVGKIKDNNTWYNMTYSEGLPGEHLDNLKLFIKKGVTINKIFLGVDEISCFTRREGHDSESIRKPYKNKFDPYVSYFFLKPSYSLAEAIVNVKQQKFYEEGMYATIYKTGSFPPNKKDIYIDENKETHKNDKIFTEPYWPSVRTNNIKQCLEDIKEFKKLCDANNIELEIFINPIFIETYKRALDKGFLGFVEQLKTIDTVYDFNQFTEITTNSLNYYENSHYRPKVGDIMVEKFFNK